MDRDIPSPQVQRKGCVRTGPDHSGKAYWRRHLGPGPEPCAGMCMHRGNTQSTDPPGIHEEASQRGVGGSLGSWDPQERAQGPPPPHQAAAVPSRDKISTTPLVPSSEQQDHPPGS